MIDRPGSAPWTRVTPRETLAALAGGELLLTLAVRIEWSHVFDLLTGNTVAALLVGLLARSTGHFQIAAKLAELVFVSYLVYQFVPRVFPERMGAWQERRPPRLFMAGGVVALLFAGALPTINLVIFSLTVGFVAYFATAQTDPFADSDGYVVQILNGIADDREFDGPTLNPDAPGLRGALVRWLFLVTAALFLTVCALVVSMVLIALGFFFPLLEVTVLAWASYDAAGDRLNAVPDPERDGPEIEETFFEAISTVFRAPLKGAPSLFLITIGVSVSALPFLLVATLVPHISPAELWFLLTTSRGIAATSLLVGFALSGAYGLWFWYRICRRFPAFLRSVADGTEPDPPVALPIGGPLPGVIPLAPAAAYALASALWLHAHPSLDLVPFWLLAVLGLAMILAFVALFWFVLRTVRVRDDSPTAGWSDNRLIPVATLVQLGAVFVAVNCFSAYEEIKRDGIAGAFTVSVDLPAFDVPMVIIMGFLAALHFSHELACWCRSFRPALRAAVVITVGAVFSVIVTYLLTISYPSPIAHGLGSGFALLFVVLAALEYRS